METLHIIIGVIAAVAFVFALLFLLRELICWYNKTNERIKNQKEIIKLLQLIAKNQQAR